MSQRERESMRYVFRIPKTVPAGKILVHNQVRRRDPYHVPGLYGMRAWLADPATEYVVCRCRWAPHLGTHYRVRGAGWAGTGRAHARLRPGGDRG